MTKGTSQLRHPDQIPSLEPWPCGKVWSTNQSALAPKMAWTSNSLLYKPHRLQEVLNICPLSCATQSFFRHLKFSHISLFCSDNVSVQNISTPNSHSVSTYMSTCCLLCAQPLTALQFVTWPLTTFWRNKATPWSTSKFRNSCVDGLGLYWLIIGSLINGVPKERRGVELKGKL